MLEFCILTPAGGAITEGFLWSSGKSRSLLDLSGPLISGHKGFVIKLFDHTCELNDLLHSLNSIITCHGIK